MTTNYRIPISLFLGIITISVIGFLIRIVSLTRIPVFVDEAIYIRWSQVMKAESTLRFLPLSDGKQPLFMWITIPFLKLFQDPLFAGRFVSVLSGTAQIMGVSILAHLIFANTRITLFSALLSAISPFTYFFDRTALVDSMLSSLGVWTITAAVFTAKTLRLDASMITGFFLGLALLTKSPAQIFVILLPLPFLIFQSIRMSLPKTLALILTSYLIGFSIYNILRLGPEFHMISRRNQDYIFSLSEMLTHPLNPLAGNLKSSINYLFYFLTPPILILFATAYLNIKIKKNGKEIIFISCIFLLPILAVCLIAKVYTARYMLFSVPYFLIISAKGLNNIINSRLIKSTTHSLLICSLIMIWPLIVIIQLILAPESVVLPRSEKSGYFELWTAGYGIKNAADSLQKELREGKPIVVGTEGYFGTLPNGLQMYLNKYKSIRVIGIGLYPEKVPQSLLDATHDNKVYLLINDSRLSIQSPQSQGLELIASYPKVRQPDGTIEHLLFFKVHEPPANSK